MAPLSFKRSRRKTRGEETGSEGLPFAAPGNNIPVSAQNSPAQAGPGEEPPLFLDGALALSSASPPARQWE